MQLPARRSDREMTRVPLTILAGYYLFLGSCEIFFFRLDGERTSIAGASAIVTSIVAAVLAVRLPRRVTTLTAATILLQLVVFAWSCLNWSTGHDGPAMVWVYVIGPLNALPLIFIPWIAVAGRVQR